MIYATGPDTRTCRTWRLHVESWCGAVASDPYSSPLAYFSKKLKRLRERAGMTQGEVAERTNYALSTVSAYETGTRIPSADFAKLADKVFGTSPTALNFRVFAAIVGDLTA